MAFCPDVHLRREWKANGRYEITRHVICDTFLVNSIWKIMASAILNSRKDRVMDREVDGYRYCGAGQALQMLAARPHPTVMGQPSIVMNPSVVDAEWGTESRT